MSRLKVSKLSLILATLALAGCSRLGVSLPGKADFDKARLESIIDERFGGIGTCMVILDAGSGAEVYRYNRHSVCMNPLPPCETFEVPEALIGLNTGLITPSTVVPWDNSPQPVREWQKPMDLKTAFAGSVPWWFGDLAARIGQQRFQAQLNAFDYGDKIVQGAATGFWMGPSAGGQLGISTLQQAQFLHRLYAGKLPVKAEDAAVVAQAMVDETRGGEVISGKTAGCPSLSDSSRQVAWWIGRLKGPKHDYVFAASMEADNEHSLPGAELATRGKTAFADVGLWPHAPS